MDDTAGFMAERDRLVRIASRILGDRDEAEDVVQQAWLRLDGAGAIANLPAWLTTVTTRLCLDRLRARIPLPMDDWEVWAGDDDHVPDPVDEVVLAETVGVALQVVLDRLTPAERVAFVLHDTFAFDFATIASVLNCSPGAARKLASRARAKVAQPRGDDSQANGEVVDAFLAAARTGDLERLVRLLAPDAVIAADADAKVAGTPDRIEGRHEVAAFFNGAARAALPTFVEGRPGAAWFLRGEAKVAFDFTVENGVVTVITFRAHPDVLAAIERRVDSKPAPARQPAPEREDDR